MFCYCCRKSIDVDVFRSDVGRLKELPIIDALITYNFQELTVTFVWLCKIFSTLNSGHTHKIRSFIIGLGLDGIFLGVQFTETKKLGSVDSIPLIIMPAGEYWNLHCESYVLNEYAYIVYK